MGGGPFARVLEISGIFFDHDDPQSTELFNTTPKHPLNIPTTLIYSHPISHLNRNIAPLSP